MPQVPGVPVPGNSEIVDAGPGVMNPGIGGAIGRIPGMADTGELNTGNMGESSIYNHIRAPHSQNT